MGKNWISAQARVLNLPSSRADPWNLGKKGWALSRLVQLVTLCYECIFPLSNPSLLQGWPGPSSLVKAGSLHPGQVDQEPYSLEPSVLQADWRKQEPFTLEVQALHPGQLEHWTKKNNGSQKDHPTWKWKNRKGKVICDQNGVAVGFAITDPV